jgi:hypothetical protein
MPLNSPVVQLEEVEQIAGSLSESPEELRQEEPQEEIPFEYSHPHDSDEFYRSAAKVYVTQNNCRQTLIAMCQGCSEFTDFFDSDDFKESMRKGKGSMKGLGLENQRLLNEACRRRYFIDKAFTGRKQDHPLFKSSSGKLLKPSKNWKKQELLEFLSTHRLDDDPRDAEFLRAKIHEIKEEVKSYKEEAALMNGKSEWEYKGWRGLTPWIRVCMVVDSDDKELREAYLTRHDQKTRQEIDGRNSEDAPKTFWDLAAEKFNKRTWAPCSYALKGWGSAYEESHDLSWEVLTSMGVEDIDGEIFKSKYDSMKGHWDTMYTNYEFSGEGKESVAARQRRLDLTETQLNVATDSDPRDLVEREAEGTDNLVLVGGDRINYLYDRPITAMYFWYVMHSNGLVSRARSQVDKEFAAEGTQVPNVFGRKKKVDQKRLSSVEEVNEEESEFRNLQKEHMAAMAKHAVKSYEQMEEGNAQLQLQNLAIQQKNDRLAIGQLRAELTEHEKTIDGFEERLELESPDNVSVRKFLQKKLAEKKARVVALLAQLEKLTAHEEQLMQQLDASRAGATPRASRKRKRPSSSRSGPSRLSVASSMSSGSGRHLKLSNGSSSDECDTSDSD